MMWISARFSARIFAGLLAYAALEPAIAQTDAETVQLEPAEPVSGPIPVVPEMPIVVPPLLPPPWAPAPEVSAEEETKVDLTPKSEESQSTATDEGVEPPVSPLAAGSGAAADYQFPVLKSGQNYNVSNGSFSYRVDLDLPPFHGIEPDLSLAYSSSRGMRAGGQSQGWLGVGWVLDGLDVIERASARQGTPRFSGPADQPDIFLWNGEPLLLCADVVGPSPSCQNGGTHFSKVESYRRFVYDSSNNSWTITLRDGTRRVLWPVNSALFEPNPNAPIELRTQYRWLLARIVDTHANAVTLDYNCSAAPQCILTSVNYTATAVNFYWEDRPDFVSYGTGFSSTVWGIAKSTKRLKSVKVTHGGATQKAFALTYAPNAVSKLNRLTEIVPYGTDVVLNTAGVVTAGVPLPRHRFQYSQTPTTMTLGPAKPVGLEAIDPPVADVDGDGKDDIVLVDPCSDMHLPVEGALGYLELNDADFVQVTTFDFQCPPQPPQQGTEYIRSILFGHFNPDKYLDFLYIYVVHKPGAQPPGHIYSTSFITAMSNGTGGWAVSSKGPAPTFVHPAPSTNSETSFRVEAQPDGTDDVITGPANPEGGSPLYGYDFDGDGLGDRVQNGTAFFSSGGSVAAPFAPAGPDDDQIPVLYADLNGDGLTDATVVTEAPTGVTLQSYLSTGRLFDSLGVNSFSASLPGLGTTDLNGDGRAELVLGDPNQGGTGSVPAFALTLGPDNASIVIPSPNWNAFVSRGFKNQPPRPFGGFVGDFNGDGLTDIVRDASGRFQLANQPTNAPIDNLMVKAFNGYGAEIAVTYQPSSKWNNDRMPSVEQTVTGITVKDGRGGTSTTGYSYTGGKYNFSERRFLGFATESEFLPCISGEIVCPAISRILSQNLGAIGAVDVEAFWTGVGGVALHVTNRTFTANNTSPPYTAWVSQVYDTTYQDPNSPSTPTYLQKRTTFNQDLYGNVTAETNYGRSDVTGDEFLHTRAFAPNLTAFIVDKPRGEANYVGTTTAGALLSATTYYYDGAATALTPPTKGDLTATAVRIDATTHAFEHFEYELPWGNRIKATDAEGNVTRWTFDSTFHLYPIEEKNALNQLRTWTWTFPCGQPATATDLNGIVTNFTYDEFCRKTREERLTTGAFQSFEYLGFGDADLQRVRTGRPHPNNGIVFKIDFFDGLGRVWRNAASGPAAAQIYVDRTFDARGNVASETFPHYSDDPGFATTFRYDGMNRLILQTNPGPDATTRSFFYDIDRRTPPTTGFGGSIPLTVVTATDELGRPSIAVSDAYERPIELTRRHDPGFGPETIAVERRSYDRLGRLLGVKDPGASSWTYTYDLRGLRLTADDPDLGDWIYAYDDAGRLISQRDARLLTTTLTYDPLGRVLTKMSPRPSGAGGTDLVTNTYDQVRAGFFNKGHLTSATKTTNSVAVATQTFDHDGEGHPVQQQWTVGGTPYTATTGFAPGGELLWKTFPDGDAPRVVVVAVPPLVFRRADRGLVLSPLWRPARQPAACGRHPLQGLHRRALRHRHGAALSQRPLYGPAAQPRTTLPDCNAWADPYRAKYHNPTFGAVVEVLTIVGAPAKVAQAVQTARAAKAVSSVAELKVQFGKVENQTRHTFRHVVEAGLDKQVVERAIRSDLSTVAGPLREGQFNGTVTVSGTNLHYSAYKLPDGTINVGRIDILP